MIIIITIIIIMSISYAYSYLNLGKDYFMISFSIKAIISWLRRRKSIVTTL